jgi:cytidylate kinase
LYEAYSYITWLFVNGVFIKMIIAIDGPAGSGKSTTAKLLAQKLGFIYLDTGAMYRAVTLYFLNNSVNLTDSSKIIKLLNSMNLTINHTNNNFTVFLDNQNINDRIRNQDINDMVSNVSKINDVRKEMVKIQRDFAKNKDILVEGRDIGSHVFPNAEFKFFIEADIFVRAERRLNEMPDNSSVSISDLVAKLEKRDMIDSNRAISPLIKANDALVIDTTSLSIDQQVNKLYNIITK